MKRVFIVMLGMVLMPLNAQESLVEQVKADLAEAQKQLTAQREQLSGEKLQLATQVTEAKLERDKKMRQADLARRSTEGKKALLAELRNKESLSRVEVQELSKMIRQYGIRMETKFLPGEAQDARLKAVFATADESDHLLRERFAVIEAGLDRLEDAIGGRVVAADATDEASVLVSGKVADFGPLRWFSSADGKQTGQYVVSPSGEVASLVPADKAAVASLLEGKSAELSIDITGGKATALASIKQGPIELIKKGGAWIYPILGIALIALVSGVIKFFQLWTFRQPKRGWGVEVAEVFTGGDEQAAAELAASPKHPVGSVLPDCVLAMRAGVDVAEEVLYEKMISVRDKLRGFLPFIAVTAATAPMLGLLGTVSGLIRTFSVISVEGTGEAQSISGGISEALITTLFGLAVAIPAFIIHALLSRKAKGLEQTTERIALGFINSVRKSKP